MLKYKKHDRMLFYNLIWIERCCSVGVCFIFILREVLQLDLLDLWNNHYIADNFSDCLNNVLCLNIKGMAECFGFFYNLIWIEKYCSVVV